MAFNYLTLPTLGYAPEMRHSTYLQDLEVYLHDHACQLECSKQYSMIETYYKFYFSSLSTHEAYLLEVVTKNNLQSSACGFLFILHSPSEEINFSKCKIGDHKNGLIIHSTLSEEIYFSKCMIGDHKNSLVKPIRSYTKYHME